MQDPHALSQARTLQQLGRLALSAGLVSRLEVPLVELVRESSIPAEMRSLTAFLAESLPGATVRDLLSDGSIAQRVRTVLPGPTRAELVGALASWLAGDAVGAPAPSSSRSAWRELAEKEGVAWCLECELERAAELHGGLGYVLDRLPQQGIHTIGGLLEGDTARMPAYLRESHANAVRAAESFVRLQIDLAQQGRQHRLIEPKAPAAGTPEHALRLRVERLRAPLRARVQSRPPARRIVGKFIFESDPPLLLRYSREERATRSYITSLSLGGEHKDLLVCRCTRQMPAVCDHALAFVEEVVHLLSEPAGSEPARFIGEVARLATSEPWQRVLEALDLVAQSGVVSDRRLGFVLSRSGSIFQLKVIADDPKSPGKGKLLHNTDEPLENTASPAERAALDALDEEPRYFSRREDPVAQALTHLAGHPRVYFKVKSKVRPIGVRKAQVALAARVRPGGGVELGLSIDGRALGEAEVHELEHAGDDPSCILYDETTGVCTVAQMDRRVAGIWSTLRKHGRELPPEAALALSERLPALAALLPIDADAALLGREVAAEPRLVLRLSPDGDGVDVRVGVRALPGVPVHPVGSGPELVMAQVAGERCCARRDLGGERAWALAQLAPIAAMLARVEDPLAFQLQGEPALDLVEALPTLAHAVDVEWPKDAERRVHTARVEQLTFRVTQGRDWFGLDGQVEVDGQALQLAELLAALRAGLRFVRVGERDWLRLSEELRARLGLVAEVTQHTRHGLEVPALAAPALAAQLPELPAPPRWAQLVARARAAAAHVPTAPGGLGVTLRDYQVSGYEWLARLAEWAPGACLADDMGLGKTIQALALLAARAHMGPALVVAPTSVCFNWMREAARVVPSLRARLARETDLLPKDLGPGDLYVVSYGVMVRDLEELRAQRFATVVLDEAQALKNPTSQRARAVLELDAGFTLAMTGTPLENRLAELWSLYRIIAPGLLGSWEGFRERFALPIERHDDGERRAALARLVRPFLLRRVKQEVAPELPQRAEVRVDVELSAEERKLYERERLTALAQLSAPTEAGGADSRFQVLAALTRLRQLACHPRLVDEHSTLASSKLARLLELVAELRDEGHRALVFSQFTSLLAQVRAALDAEAVPYLYLDGSTPAARRRELVDAFQAGQGDLFLISLKAGGTGLNLTGADNVIHLDPWWNPAVEDQASDRSHRIGQTRPVTIYKLVARGTVEEKIVAMQEDKRALVAGVLEGTSGTRAATTDELLALLADESPAVVPVAPAPARRRRRGKAEG